jgi:hypothetical protein
LHDCATKLEGWKENVWDVIVNPATDKQERECAHAISTEKEAICKVCTLYDT